VKTCQLSVGVEHLRKFLRSLFLYLCFVRATERENPYALQTLRYVGQRYTDLSQQCAAGRPASHNIINIACYSCVWLLQLEYSSLQNVGVCREAPRILTERHSRVINAQLTLLLLIPAVPGSELGPETGCPDRGSSWFSQSCRSNSKISP
jgi:hypothetical protein